MEKKHDNTPDKAAETLPGVDINRADDNKVTPQLLNEETKELNNNPRTNEIDK